MIGLDPLIRIHNLLISRPCVRPLCAFGTQSRVEDRVFSIYYDILCHGVTNDTEGGHVATADTPFVGRCHSLGLKTKFVRQTRLYPRTDCHGKQPSARRPFSYRQIFTATEARRLALCVTCSKRCVAALLTSFWEFAAAQCGM